MSPERRGAARTAATASCCSLPLGRHRLIALTAAGGTVVVGGSAEVGLAEPVRDLTAAADARRRAAELGLARRDATDAMVRWPGGEQRCSRRVYDDEGGVTVSVGPAADAASRSAVSTRIPAGPDRAGGRRSRARAGRPRSTTGSAAPAAMSRGSGSSSSPPSSRPPAGAAWSCGPPAGTRRTTRPRARRCRASGRSPSPRAAGARSRSSRPQGRGWLACFVDPGAPAPDGRRSCSSRRPPTR